MSEAGDGSRWFVMGFLLWVTFEGLALIVLNSAWLLPALSLVSYLCGGGEGWTAFEIASAASVGGALLAILGLAAVRWFRAQKKPAGS